MSRMRSGNQFTVAYDGRALDAVNTRRRGGLNLSRLLAEETETGNEFQVVIDQGKNE